MAIEKVGPAVVHIRTLYRPRARDPLERILRDLMGQPFPQQGEGSGIIIDAKRGYVLTNAHVVRRATQMEVGLADGRRLEADKVGSDPLTDIAVLRVPASELPEASLGSAADLPIGSWVIAIGNPFGFENSVTVGVLSAKDRQIEGQGGIMLQDLLQTDASINPGNSGGALVDLNGRVVGIPTAIIPLAQGMGFAVSVDVARQVAERLIATGKMPWLGITHGDIPPAVRSRLRVPEGQGTLVVDVIRGGPAHLAGIRPGDVILQMDDDRVLDMKSFGFAIRSHDAGDDVTMKVWRSRREIGLQVTLGEVPQELLS
jgi:serine protease Do